MLLEPSTPSTQAVVPPARVALAGNPNCGKSSLFNALCRAHQHVANYPGVTVERRTGECRLGTRRIELIDLPGTYGLSAYSPEERVTEQELSTELDLVVVVADSTQLGRGLVLFAQILQTGVKVVLCLNMADEAQQAGLRVDLVQMERLLGVPVVETVAHRGEGLDELKRAIERALQAPQPRPRLVLGEELDAALLAIKTHLPASLVESPAVDFITVRLLLSDATWSARLASMPDGQPALEETARQRRWLESMTGQDMPVFVAERTFGFVDGLLREVQTQKPRTEARQLTDRLDSVLVHPILGLPLFALVMYGIFWVTFSLGDPPMGWIEMGTTALGNWVSSLWPAGSPSLLRSLLVDGVIAGVGGVVVFLPNIILLFLGLAFLEDTGYLARAAFLTDRVMHRFGLHGKSFLPLLTGFGCSIPGIMATRTLENERDRLTTMLVLPLMSCGARLPIWMLLVPAFFAPPWRAPMLFLIYALGILLALGLALLLRRTVLSGEDAPFVMELPPYRWPTLRSVVQKMRHRSSSYLRKAGTIILGISILLWAATTFPILPEGQSTELSPAAPRAAAAASADHGLATGAPLPEMTPDEQAAHQAAAALEYSLAGRLGHGLEPVFAPLGFDWKLVTAMIGAFAAKEVFVAQMGIVTSLADPEGNSEGLRARLAREYTPLIGVSLMLFLLIATPCMATVAVTRRESGKWRWALLQFFGLTVLAYLISLSVFQAGTWLGLGG